MLMAFQTCGTVASDGSSTSAELEVIGDAGGGAGGAGGASTCRRFREYPTEDSRNSLAALDAP